MIGFLNRLFIVSMLTMALFAITGITLFGETNNDNWRILLSLIEERWRNTPMLMTICITGVVTFVLFIAIWMTTQIKLRDMSAARNIKKLHDPTKPLVAKRLPKSIRKPLLEAENLLVTQRKSLHRITNERIELEDEKIQEKIIIERQRLARELHDSVSQQLFAASMMLSALSEQQTPQPKTIEQIEKIVQQAQLEMRALLLHLRPVALRNKTLAQGLRELVVELEQKVNVLIGYQLEEIPLSKAQEDHLFRIAQEAISNTLRHAKATEIDMLFVLRAERAILRIQDNGVGFRAEERAQKTTSYGLQNMVDRAIEIGCVCKIVSVPGDGTIVEVQIPLEVMKND